MDRERARVDAANQQDRWEKELAGVLDALFEKQEGVVLARLTGVKSRKGTRHWAPAGERKIDPKYIVDIARWVHDAADAVRDVFVRMLDWKAKDTAAELLDDDEVLDDDQPFDADLDDILEQRIEFVQQAVSKISQRVQQVITQAEDDGDDMESIKKKVTKTYIERDKWGKRIANQNIAAALNQAAMRGGMFAGAVVKEWLSSRDEKVRATHKHADGQLRPIAAPFRLGGIPEHPPISQLQFPCDPTAPPGEVMNCRCSLLFSLDGGAHGDLDPLGELLPQDRKSIRRVRTAEGAREYGQPIGTVIARDALGHFSNPARGIETIRAGQAQGGHGVGVSTSFGTSRARERETEAEKWERVFRERERYEPSPRAAGARAAFIADHPDAGELPEDLTEIRADAGKAKLIADYYMDPDALPVGDNPLARAAYADLLDEVAEQMRYLVDAGVTVEYLTSADIIERGLDPEGLNPYPTATAQRDDVENGRLMIASIAEYTDSHHPLLGNELGGTYDQFRAVHDFFGHAAVGTGFDRHGEYQAWLAHMSMFIRPGAKEAASSELTGENSTLTQLRGMGAPHRAVLLPSHLVMPVVVNGHLVRKDSDLDLEQKVRRVRTSAGAREFDQPIGTIITLDADAPENRARLRTVAAAVRDSHNGVITAQDVGSITLAAADGDADLARSLLKRAMAWWADMQRYKDRNGVPLVRKNEPVTLEVKALYGGGYGFKGTHSYNPDGSIKKVRTAAGAQHFGQPIGSVIKKDVIKKPIKFIKGLGEHDDGTGLDTFTQAFGMKYNPANADHPAVVAARAWKRWGELPTLDFPLAKVPLKATEHKVRSKPIKRVLSGEPFRKGYDPQLVFTDAGVFVADGHHRIAMHVALDHDTMPAKVLDLRGVTDAASAVAKLQAIDADLEQQRIQREKEREERLQVEATEIAEKLRAEAITMEPSITPVIVQAVLARGGFMDGLNLDVADAGALTKEEQADLGEWRFKPFDSIRGKIIRKAHRKKTDARGGASGIGDILRYTAVIPTDQYTDGAKDVLAGLAKAGFRPTVTNNYWPKGDAYSGLNILFGGKGQEFEVQFHTPESLAAKTANHEDYEISRDDSQPLEVRIAAWERQIPKWDDVPQPPGWLDFGSFFIYDPPGKGRGRTVNKWEAQGLPTPPPPPPKKKPSYGKPPKQWGQASTFDDLLFDDFDDEDPDDGTVDFTKKHWWQIKLPSSFWSKGQP